MNLSGRHVLVIGLGESGLAAARWLIRQGAVVRVADSRQQPPNVDALRAFAPDVKISAGPFVPATFDEIDLMVISPGVPSQEACIAEAVARGVPLVSEIELFVRAVRALSPQAKIIAITGSNGKTTTTALTAHLLRSAGVSAVACGNISPAALDALMAALDHGILPAVWVLELSSFQLETTHTLEADAATVLNVSEDHLDRYSGMDAYAAAKARVYQGCAVSVRNRNEGYCASADPAESNVICFGQDAPLLAKDYGIVNGTIVRGNESIVACDSLRIVGLHNVANAMAALALCEAIGMKPQALVKGLQSFSGLSHRVEFVAEIGGIAYYDDSKGTNVGATLAAVQGMGRKVALILGGEGKGQDFSPLAPVLERHARAIALIGRDAALIAGAIGEGAVPRRFCADMTEAVRWCATMAMPGDAVLLSPACASFDMYRNYEHRAAVFVAAVRALKEEAA